jgi:NarL family two-component system response regulator LiaR
MRSIEQMAESPLKTEPARETNTITILIADDHPLLREALRNVLEKQTDFKVVAEAGDGEAAVKLAVKLVPDIVIMDISMPVLNGLEATRIIKEKCPRTAVLVLTVHNDIEHVLGILEAGADGYLTKSVFGEQVPNAVRSLANGDTILTSQIFKHLLQHAIRYPTKPTIINNGQNLTSRDMEILKLAAKGLNNKDIALKTNLSLRTVKGYMVDLFTKLNVSSRTEAVITGLRTGIITLSDLD